MGDATDERADDDAMRLWCWINEVRRLGERESRSRLCSASWSEKNSESVAVLGTADVGALGAGERGTFANVSGSRGTGCVVDRLTRWWYLLGSGEVWLGCMWEDMGETDISGGLRSAGVMDSGESGDSIVVKATDRAGGRVIRCRCRWDLYVCRLSWYSGGLSLGNQGRWSGVD